MPETSRFDALLTGLAAEHQRHVEDLQLQISTLKDQLKEKHEPSAVQHVLSAASFSGEGNGAKERMPSVCRASSFGMTSQVSHLAAPHHSHHDDDLDDDDLDDDEFTAPQERSSAGATALARVTQLVRNIAHGKNSTRDQSARTTSSSTAAGRITSLVREGLQKVTNQPAARKPSRNTQLFPALALEREYNYFQRMKRGSGRLRNMLESTAFEWFLTLVIMMNTLTMCVEVQYQGFDVAYSLEIVGYDKPARNIWPHAQSLLSASEKVFVVMYCVELALRLIAFRFQFFNYAFHWLDLITVVAGILEWIGSSMFDPFIIRLLRLTRIARMLKSFKNARFLDAVHFLLSSMQASLATLFWSLVLLIIIQCLATLTMAQLLAGWFEDARKSPEAFEVFMYYGTFSRCILTMFEVLLGNWPIPCRVLTDYVGEEFGAFVLIYKCVCGFAVINVISAVFIQQTMKVMSQDTDIMLRERSRTEEKFRKSLMRMFAILDMSQDGFVSLEELQQQLNSPEVRMLCFKMGLSVHDLEDIFHLHNISQDGMTIEKFIGACHSVRMQANSLDLARVLMHARHVSVQMESMQEQLDINLQRVKALHDIVMIQDGLLPGGKPNGQAAGNALNAGRGPAELNDLQSSLLVRPSLDGYLGGEREGQTVGAHVDAGGGDAERHQVADDNLVSGRIITQEFDPGRDTLDWEIPFPRQ